MGACALDTAPLVLEDRRFVTAVARIRPLSGDVPAVPGQESDAGPGR
jgi:hypothetical protein